MNVFKRIWIKFLKAVFCTCGEATYLMAKEECDQLSLVERTKLRLHLWKCKYCKMYKAEQELLAHSLDKLRNDVEVDKYLYYLTPEQKERLKSTVSNT